MSTQTTPRNILIADDEPSMLKLLNSLLLGHFDCAVNAEASGDAVIARCAEEAHDLLVTDMVMPGPHGLELVNTLKREHPALDIIVMTGHGADFPYVEVIAAGASDFIVKPFKVNELTAKLERVFRERDQRQAAAQADQRFRTLFARFPEPLLLVSAQSAHILNANPAAESALPNATPGAALETLIAEDAVPGFYLELDRVRTAGAGIIEELPLREGRGASMTVELLPAEAPPAALLLRVSIGG